MSTARASAPRGPSTIRLRALSPASRCVYDRTMGDDEAIDLVARMVERDERHAKMDDQMVDAAAVLRDGLESAVRELEDVSASRLGVQFEAQALLLSAAIERGDPAYLRHMMHVVGLIIRGALEEKRDEQGIPPR